VPGTLGIYVHVPFCAVRCGYCDFNTYTSRELGPGADPDSYVESALAELALARRELGPGARTVGTVFVGGGTPTLLPAADLARLLTRIDDLFGLTPDAEVTTEANPDSVNAESLAQLRAAGFTRVSFGMQSAVPHVLATLERTHDPDRVPLVVGWARAAGFDQVSLDLIYGTPGESLADLDTSLGAVLAMRPDHVSAYALVVEEGTRLAARVRRRELAGPDDDDLADRYLLVDERLAAAGYGWYEVSNWALSGQSRCRHNLGYWRGADWWGIGPGAHSHVGGVRWWNVKHPAAYAARLAAGESPAAGREVLTAEQVHVERVLLGLRLAEGLPMTDLSGAARAAAARAVAAGLLEQAAWDDAGRAVLTRRGRLLADAVVRDLVD
jgi:oxygen-independent coproporphyrinogen-3 oxidase